jgi:hypothetical protein
LRGEGFAVLVATEVDHALDRARLLTLDQVIDRAEVKAVAAKYVAGFTLPGAIPEIAGEIATRLRSHPANDAALGTVLPRRHVTEIVEKIAELRPVRELIAARLAASPSIQAWLAGFLRSLATDAVASNRRLVTRVPGVSSALSAGERLAAPALREADQLSREVTERAAVTLLRRWRDRVADSLRDDDVAAAILEVWDGVADRPVRDLLDELDDGDLVDLLVVGYDTWLEIRTSDYLRALIDTGVDYFFDTYGGFALTDLLAEFGLGREDLIEEALRFAPRVIDALDEAGLLADLVRRQLSGFYASPEARAILRPRPA